MDMGTLNDEKSFCGTGLALYALAKSSDLMLDLWIDKHTV